MKYCYYHHIFIKIKPTKKLNNCKSQKYRISLCKLLIKLFFVSLGFEKRSVGCGAGFYRSKNVSTSVCSPCPLGQFSEEVDSMSIGCAAGEL